MDLRHVGRLDPPAAVRLWHGLRYWHSMGPPNGVTYETLDEACSAADPWALVQELVECGCPLRVLPPIPDAGGRCGDVACRARKALRGLLEHLPPRPAWCFEAVANLNLAEDEPLLRLIGAGVRPWGDPERAGRLVDDVREHDLPFTWAAAETIQHVAHQVAVLGRDEVTLWEDDVERLRTLVEMDRFWGADVRSPRVRLRERKRPYVVEVNLGGEGVEPEFWSGEPAEPEQPALWWGDRAPETQLPYGNQHWCISRSESEAVRIAE